MKRSFLSQLLTLLLCIVGINAWADNSGSCGDGVTWTLSNDTLIISYSGNGTGKMDSYYSPYQPWNSFKDSIKAIVIEDGVASISRDAFENCNGPTSVTISNSVTEIGDNAFHNCSSLTTVSIPEGVTTIGFGAFSWCSSLTSINIPSSVISIGNNPFSNCSALTSIIVNTENTVYDSRDNCNAIIEKSSNKLIAGCKESTIPNSVTMIGGGAFWGCSSLISVIIPNSVKGIDDEAFFDCSALTSVTIPNSVESIGYSAFSGCSSLASLSLPNSVTKIGGSAFSGCSALTSVTIPNSVTEIGENIFSGCSALSSIIVQDGNEKYDSRNYCYAIIETATNTIISGCKNTIIPNSVTSIGWYAFSGCTGLYSITIPNNVTSIGEGAFSGCYGLTSVSIPANLTSIKRNTFRYCSALTSIAIPNSVTSIGDDAFTGCSGLTSVTIGKSVTEIHNSAFSACYSLTSICSLIKNPMNIKSSVFSNSIYDTCTLYVPEGTVDKYRECTGWKDFLNIKEGTPTETSGYCGSKAKWTLSEGILTISGEGKMNNYDSAKQPWYSYRDYIENVVIEDGVTKIGNYSFRGYPAITSVTIGNDVKEIGECAFDGCQSLTSVIIGKSVNKIGKYALLNCTNLSNVVVQSENTKFDSRDNCNAIIETSTNTLVLGCKGTIIPNSVTSIGYQAFYRCFGLTYIIIPNSVTSIGDDSFGGCSGLISIDIGNSVTSIGKSSFSGCSSLSYLTIPNSVTSIGENAFTSCRSLNSITIPNSVSSIGSNAFFYCSGLASIDVEAGNVKYDSRDNCNAIIETSTNTLIRGCKNTIIPNDVTSILDEAFNDCFGLISITIPNSVTDIGDFTFNGCSDLTSITIGNSVRRIDWDTFSGCSSLSSITIESGNAKYDSRDNCNAVIETSTNALIVGCKNTVIPNSVERIVMRAFISCVDMNSITIPNNIIGIGDHAFERCNGLTSIYSLIDNPWNINYNVFNQDIYENCTLYVPEGTVDKYRECTGWKEFWNIKEGSPTGISTIKMKKATEPKYYTIDGRRISKPQKGLNIINGKKVIVK